MDLQPCLRKGKRLRFFVAVAAASGGCVLGVWLLACLFVQAEPFFKTTPPDFDHTQPMVGELAPDFSLQDTEGSVFRLSERIGRRPLVIEFGSLT